MHTPADTATSIHRAVRFGLPVLLGLSFFAQLAGANTAPVSVERTRQTLASASVPWLPNVGQWDARAAFRAQSFAGAVWVTTDGELVHQFNGAKVPVGAGLTALGNRHSARSSPRLQPEAPMARSPGWVLTERFVGGNIKQAPRGSAPQPARASFFTGNAPSQANNLPSYGQIELGEVFPGVTVALKATNANVEKLFTVAPGRDPNAIRMAIDGASALSIGRDGSLIATTGNGDIAFTAPIAFQENDHGERVMVGVAYRLVGADLAALSGAHPSDAKSSPTDSATTYTFTLGDYDTTRPVVIDPLLASTYLGGGGSDQINAMAVHPHTGQVYVAGETNSPSFPQSGSGGQTSATGISCFVSRYSADLQQLLQTTYVGNGDVRCFAIAIHPGSGVVYVAGLADSTSNFPAPSTTSAIQPNHADPTNSGSRDGFVALLSADLRSLTKATFFGGTAAPFGSAERINAIAVHPHTGFVHIVGFTGSSALPGAAVGTQTSLGGSLDAFIARLPADLMNAANVRYTFIGGNSVDRGNALAIDLRSGDVFVAGDTGGGLPSAMLSGATQGAFAGNGDAFVARLKQDLSAVVRATYLGGATGDDPARSIALHPLTGEVVVAGATSSSDFPQAANGAQPTFGGSIDGFVSRLSADLTAILQSTYLGGSGTDCQSVCRLAIHPQSGEVFVAGATPGGLLPAMVADGHQSSYGGGDYDTFIVRLNAALTARRAGTYLGGTGRDEPYAIAIEPNGGSVYVAGLNVGGGFPMMNAQQSTVAGFEGFVSRLSTDLTAVNRTPNPFSFIHQSNVPPNSTRTSNEVQIIITPTPPDNHQVAYVSGGANSEFCVTNTAGCCATPLPVCSGFATGWINGPYEFLSGDRIAVRHISAASGTAETKLIISGTAYPFRSSTGNANIACNLDMNGDNVLTATVEGLILVRAMLGFGGNAAVAGTGITPFAWENTLRPALNQHCGTNFPFTPIL